MNCEFRNWKPALRPNHCRQQTTRTNGSAREYVKDLILLNVSFIIYIM